jgi:outer membrane protein TolC
MEALERAINRQTKAMKAFAKVKKDAREEWKESQEYEPSDYLTWVINNRPDVANAENEADSAAAEVYAAQATIGGSGSDELSTIRSRLQSLFKNQQLPG